MRTVAIAVHNNQKLEIFVEKRKEGFELWVVGLVKRSRKLLNHYLTHDDLEANLEYAKPGDLVWRDASPSEIPAEKDWLVIASEENIKQGVFWDFVKPEEEELEHEVVQTMGCEVAKALQSVAQHTSFYIDRLTTDRKEMNNARKLLPGRWTNGAVTLTLEADHRFRSDPPIMIRCHAPDLWNFKHWQLVLMNSEHKCGTSPRVLRVDEHELHLEYNLRHRLAQVFRRMKVAADHVDAVVGKN